MSELLRGLTRKDVQATMRRIEPQESYSQVISDQLQETVYGQPQAMDAISRRLALFDTGLSDPKRPLGTMLFLGPSGVGKTEAARAAAKHMFNDTHSERLKIINMAELTESHDTKRFVGSPPSYVGHSEQPLIPHNWLHKGRSIIVLDELEKAHPAVVQLFLGALDTGTMDSRNGSAGTQPLHFANTLFIITSNVGGREIHDTQAGMGSIGFKTSEVTEEQKQRQIARIAEQSLKRAFSPEFLNRIDDTVVFQEITDRNTHTKIFDKFVAYRNADLQEARGAEAPYFAVTEEFRDHILDIAGNRGGREMKRELERHLFDKAADVFMGMDVKGRPLIADVDPDTRETVFYTDDVPIAEGEKKDEPGQQHSIIPSDSRTESGSSDTEGTSQQKEEPQETVEPYKGDSGDETPPPQMKIGFQIAIWNEDTKDRDEHDEPAARLISIRNVRLP